jgi:hypothetical protein
MTDPVRSRITLRLVDASHADGEMPLAALARIAEETQQLVRRLARSIADRSGPGRTPVALEEQTEMFLVGFSAGSTLLELAGPRPEPQLDIGRVPVDTGTQAFAALVEAVQAAAAGSALPDAFDQPSTRGLRDWLGVLAEEATTVDVTAEIEARQPTTIHLEPKTARAAVVERETPSAPSARPERTIEGTLYAVNLHTGRYQIEDDVGHAIAAVATLFTAEQVAPLLGQRVQARGVPQFDDGGRLQSLELTRIASAPEIEGFDREAFFRVTELAELVRDVEPIRSIEDLAIPDLSEDDIESFLRAINE